MRLKNYPEFASITDIGTFLFLHMTFMKISFYPIL
jgi:hypothetical protein